MASLLFISTLALTVKSVERTVIRQSVLSLSGMPTLDDTAVTFLEEEFSEMLPPSKFPEEWSLLSELSEVDLKEVSLTRDLVNKILLAAFLVPGADLKKTLPFVPGMPQLEAAALTFLNEWYSKILPPSKFPEKWSILSEMSEGDLKEVSLSPTVVNEILNAILFSSMGGYSIVKTSYVGFKLSDTEYTIIDFKKPRVAFPCLTGDILIRPTYYDEMGLHFGKFRESIAISSCKNVEGKLVRKSVVGIHWQAVLPKQKNHYATVCHAKANGFFSTRGDIRSYEHPPPEMVRQWVAHYLSLGFSHIFLYAWDPAAIMEMPNVSWILLPWLGVKPKNVHSTGQVWTEHHCLYLNKMAGTKWTLIADMDEWLVAKPIQFQERGHSFKNGESDKKSIVSQIVAKNPHAHHFTFGSYRINSDQQLSELCSNWLHCFPIQKEPECRHDRTKVSPFTCTQSQGDRKVMVNVKKVCTKGIHAAFLDPCLSGKYVDINARDFGLLHIRTNIGFQTSWSKAMKQNQWISLINVL
eukprot:g738.t1